MLKLLEVSGFKSFAKKTDLGFNSSITAIVGPNGSGKSNVAEAFRFVLGEQSIKSMRGKRGEDLIFNGSAKVGKMNRAGVKVFFDNRKRVLPIDFDEVSIERVVHRDGVNEYFINGSQVRLKDVMELLAGAHVGASGHHIISQGEADKILNSNISERREMVEDALGLKIYQYKRQESERKLEKTEENIKSVESLRREIAPHLKFLRKQVEKVEKAIEMKQSLVLLYKDYFKREDVYIQHSRSFIDIEKKAPLEELRRLDRDLTDAKALLDSSKKEDKRAHELVSIEQRLKAERSQKDNLTRDLGRVEGEMSGLERTLRRHEEARKQDEMKTVNLKEVEVLRGSIDELVSEGEKEGDISKIKEVLIKIKDRIYHFINEHRRKEDDTEKRQIEGEVAKLVAEKKDIEGRMVAILDRERVLNEEYRTIKDAVEKEKEGGLEAEKTILKIMARQNEINSKYATIKALEEKLIVEEDELKRELGEAAHLAGREAVTFDAYSVLSDGRILSLEEIVGESRTLQTERRRNIEKIKIRLEEFGAGGGDEIMKEFKESEERDTFLAKEVDDLTRSAESLRTLVAELEQKLDLEFKEGIKKINTEFQKFFALMFGGGTANLEVVKEVKRKRKSLASLVSDEGEGEYEEDSSEDEEETKEGLVIHISLPHKKIRGLEMLSGGERALTSIALLFAMSQVNPPPFIILDETDAALDEANSRKYGDMIENLSKYSQLILITHNRETMSRAGVLYGVTMGSDGVSRLLSIHFEEAVQVAK